MPPLLEKFKSYSVKIDNPTKIIVIYLIILLISGGYLIMETQPQGETGTYQVDTLGAVKTGELNFNVYWDRFRTQPVTHIDWGEMEPGETKTVTIYVANFELRSIYIVNIVSQNSDPIEFTTFHGVTGDLNEVGSYRVEPINLSLYISPNIIGIETFKFDIIITISDT